MSNIYLIIILIFLIGNYLLEFAVDYLNIKALKKTLPKEFDGFYDDKKYYRSQEYLKENTKFGFIIETFDLLIIVLMILAGGFNYFDNIVRGFGLNEIFTGIVFFFVLIILNGIITLPFSIYQTFRIEEKYGFNRTTPKIFIVDIIKSLLLMLIIGTPFLWVVLWFFETAGKLAPLYVWVFIILFQLIMLFLAPVLIMPLFNKYTPLEDGELKDRITEYAKQEGFKMKGIFTMDGSKRSSKSNAFFTGFGSFRRIVLYDTLIEKHSVDELVAIIAHEMGHYKLKHIFKTIILSFFELGLMLFVLSLFLNNKELFEAFKMEHISVYASLLFFGFIYSPISSILSILSNYFSRKHEYEADEYAVKTTGLVDDFVKGLKKLSVDNLSNLTPHSLKVFLEYSHPPILKRIDAIRKVKQS